VDALELTPCAVKRLGRVEWRPAAVLVALHLVDDGVASLDLVEVGVRETELPAVTGGSARLNHRVKPWSGDARNPRRDTIDATSPTAFEEQRIKDGAMAVKLNERAFEQAKALIGERRVVVDERDAWSEHQPTPELGNEHIRLHGFRGYGRWYLGIDDGEAEDTKGRHAFPYGDFQRVHRCGVLSAESRAGQFKHVDVENAAAHLHGMLDALRRETSASRG
jgi:hypothetical protein